MRFIHITYFERFVISGRRNEEKKIFETETKNNYTRCPYKKLFNLSSVPKDMANVNGMDQNT